MTFTNFIVSFGMPRSGTTLLEQMFLQGKGYFYHKLAEGNALHPMQSTNGLITLAHAFRLAPKLFVRTVRHPVDLIESRLCMSYDNLVEHLDSAKLKHWMDDIRRESNNYYTQLELFQSSSFDIRNLCMVMVYYEELGTEKGRKDFFNRLRDFLPDEKTNIEILQSFLETTWGNPVRPGRLSRGRKKILSDNIRNEIKNKLSDIIEKEGLNND
jgi:hypothetical protein